MYINKIIEFIYFNIQNIIIYINIYYILFMTDFIMLYYNFYINYCSDICLF